MNELLEAALADARATPRLPEPAVRRHLRQRAGLTQAALAQTLGVTRATLTRWEQALRTPRGEDLASYAAALDRLAMEVGLLRTP